MANGETLEEWLARTSGQEKGYEAAQEQKRYEEWTKGGKPHEDLLAARDKTKEWLKGMHGYFPFDISEKAKRRIGQSMIRGELMTGPYRRPNLVQQPGQEYRDQYNRLMQMQAGDLEALRRAQGQMYGASMLQGAGIGQLEKYAAGQGRISPFQQQAAFNQMAEQMAAQRAAATGSGMAQMRAIRSGATGAREMAAENVRRGLEEDIRAQQALTGTLGAARAEDIQAMQAEQAMREAESAWEHSRRMMAMGYLGMGEQMAQFAQNKAMEAWSGLPSQPGAQGPDWLDMLLGSASAGLPYLAQGGGGRSWQEGGPGWQQGGGPQGGYAISASGPMGNPPPPASGVGSPMSPWEG
jgi:hypothetical protein